MCNKGQLKIVQHKIILEYTIYSIKYSTKTMFINISMKSTWASDNPQRSQLQL